MKKIYSKILLSALLVFTGLKNIFIKNAIAFNDTALMGKMTEMPSESPLEKTVNGIKLIMLFPILIVGIIFCLLYAILKLKKKDLKNLNFFLISGILGIVLYLVSVFLVTKFHLVT